MKKRRIVTKATLKKFDIYDESFSELCDDMASAWAAKIERITRLSMSKHGQLKLSKTAA